MGSKGEGDGLFLTKQWKIVTSVESLTAAVD